MNKKDENNRIEYKKELNEHFEKTVVAFLNTKGGTIFIGIDDNKKAIGLKNINTLQLKIKDRIKNNIVPSAMGLFDVLIEDYQDKEIIKVHILEGLEKPYYIKHYGMSEKGCYVRNGSASDPMPQALIEKLFASRNKHSLKNILSPQQNLRFEQLRIYYQEMGLTLHKKNFYQFLEFLTPNKKLNYVAFLLSDTNTISIKVARYASTDRSHLIENNELGYCCLVKSAKQVIDKLMLENKTTTVITSTRRIDQRLIHPIALREAVMNAFIHNDYTSEEAPKFEIFSDRIEITSFGGLPPTITKEEFFDGCSIQRNRELMRVFRDLELAEYLGSGIPRILKYYPKKIFKITDNFIRVIFPFNTVGKSVEMTVENTVEKKKNKKLKMSPYTSVEMTVENTVEIIPESISDKIIYAMEKKSGHHYKRT